MIDHERRVLYHLLNERGAFPVVLESLTADHFGDPDTKRLFQVAVHFHLHSKVELTPDSALDVIETRSANDEVRSSLVDLVTGLFDLTGSHRQDLEYAIQELDRGLRAGRISTITASMAEKLAANKFSDIREEIQGLWEATTPGTEGSYRLASDLGDEYEARYRRTKAGDAEPTYSTGFAQIDAATGGMRRKRLWIWSGYTSHAKTRCAQEVAYHFGREGRRVLFVSLEMDEEDLMLGWYARASHEVVKKAGHPDIFPLNAEAIRDGRLDDVQEKVYRNARQLLSEQFPVMVWVPADASISEITRRVMAEQLIAPLDLVVIDYVALCRSDVHRRNYNEQIGDLMRESKRLARRCDVPVLGLHQLNRDGFEAAQTRGYYLMKDLANSAEVERNADVAIWNLLTPEMRRSNEMCVGIMKNRFGPLMEEGHRLYTDFGSYLIADSAERGKPASFFEDFMA